MILFLTHSLLFCKLSFSISFIFDKRLGGCEVFEEVSRVIVDVNNTTVFLGILGPVGQFLYNIETLFVFQAWYHVLIFPFKKI